jgi:hypothetical protein
MKMFENVDKMWRHNANDIIGNVEMWDAGPASVAVATNVDVVWTSMCCNNMFHISVYAYLLCAMRERCANKQSHTAAHSDSIAHTIYTPFPHSPIPQPACAYRYRQERPGRAPQARPPGPRPHRLKGPCPAAPPGKQGRQAQSPTAPPRPQGSA